eukprot:GILI01043867.1.p1 GENE.GILI01043867.1~~GILI01043867.1.p1  ORF type:complete len:123 (+),score=8.80 GILI01043867.1:464-832(+)
MSSAIFCDSSLNPEQSREKNSFHCLKLRLSKQVIIQSSRFIDSSSSPDSSPKSSCAPTAPDLFNKRGTILSAPTPVCTPMACNGKAAASGNFSEKERGSSTSFRQYACGESMPDFATDNYYC